MPTNFISLVQYLQADELELLKKQFNDNKIIYLINEQGASTYDIGDYYEVKVSSEHYSRAKTIVNSFRATRFIKTRKCPKCGSLQFEPITKKNFFQRIFYLGTTQVRCKKCKTKYFI